MLQLFTHRRSVGLLLTLLLVCLSGSASVAQQTGSVIGQTLTFTASDTATMNFVVAPQGAGAVTILTLEFGPEGNDNSNNADQPLPVTFMLGTTINGQPAAQQFGSSGGVDQQLFPGKTVVLVHNPPGVPGYQLVITHTTGVIAQENWMLRIGGLPAAGVRAIATIDPTISSASSFSRVTPATACTPPPGPLGTMLRQSLSFVGTSVAKMTFGVAQRDPNSTTSAWLEFGADGSGTPNPTPLPGGVLINLTATIADSTITNSLPPDGTPVAFGPNIKVSLVPPQPSAPGLYVLNIARGPDVPASVESWTLELDGLSPLMRGIATLPTTTGAASNPVFQSLFPIGACPPPQLRPAIAISTSQVTAGDSPIAINVTSSGGFDLSHLTTAHVSLDNTNGISNFAVTDVSSTELLITFDIDKCAFRGQRNVVVNAHNTTLTAPFAVVHLPGQDTISVTSVAVSSPGAITSQNTAQIVGSSCVDLTGVTSHGITIAPSDGNITNVSNIAALPGANTFQFTYAYRNCAAPTPHTLTIQQLSATFTPAIPPPAIQVSGNFMQGRHVNMDILPTGCVDLSQVGLNQITINPDAGIGALTLNSSSATQVGLGFDLAATAPTGPRQLSVTAGSRTLSTNFLVRAFQLCPEGTHCCFGDRVFGCALCRRFCPRPPRPGCPAGQKCCDSDPTTGQCLQCIPMTRQCM